MNRGISLKGLIVLLAMGLAAAPAAHAQMQDLNWRIHGGAILPIGDFGEYFRTGPTVGFDVGYPLQDRVDVLAEFDFGYINTHDFYPMPAIKLWGYRLGMEADILPDRGDNLTLLRAHVGAGGVSQKSREFWLESRPFIRGEVIDKTTFSGVAGVRLGLRTDSGLIWWLGGALKYSPLDDVDGGNLREAARNELGELGSATTLSITLGFNLNRR